MPSATFTVNAASVTGEIAVAASSTVNLALVDSTGANPIVWSIVGNHDPAASNPTITPAVSPSGATASFTMPAGAAQAYIVQAQIRGGKENNLTVAAYTFRAKIGVNNAAGKLPFCAGETLEASATHGWVPKLNQVIAGIIGSTGSTDNAILRADGTGGGTAQGSIVTLDDNGNADGFGTIKCVEPSDNWELELCPTVAALASAAASGGSFNLNISLSRTSRVYTISFDLEAQQNGGSGYKVTISGRLKAHNQGGSTFYIEGSLRIVENIMFDPADGTDQGASQVTVTATQSGATARLVVTNDSATNLDFYCTAARYNQING